MEEWRKRKKIDDFFIDFQKMEEMMNNLVKSMFDENDMKDRKKPVIMGFSMKIDENGRPRIKEFGNIKATPKKTTVTRAREPLIDVIESANDVTITAEMPGVERKNIKLNILKDRVTIATNVPETFYKVIALDEEVLPKSAKVNLKNGILEITVRKKRK